VAIVAMFLLRARNMLITLATLQLSPIAAVVSMASSISN
jgi:hypothetical protein